MITGFTGFVLNAFSIVVLSAVLIIVSISVLLMTEIWQRLNMSARDRCRMLWLIVLSPWLVGALATFIVVALSQPKIAMVFAGNFIHWHHLNEFHWYSWHGLLLLTVLTLTLVIFVRVVRRVVAVAQTADLLSQFSQLRPDGVFELDSDTHAAFTAGVRNPRCYMTRALIDELNRDEYEVIRLHEMSHVASRDPARRALFFVLAGLYPFVIARFLNSQMITATEQVADEQVVKKNLDRAFIARVLLKVHRLVKQAMPINQSAMGVCQFGADSIEQRISYLLSDRESTDFSFILAFVLLVLLAVACAMGADSLHHAIELPWQH